MNNIDDTDKSTLITFSTCFYILKAKFDVYTYVNWINNFLSLVTYENNFNLVIYTDRASSKHIYSNPNVINNPKIKVIIKPLEDFYNYKYKEKWINNHHINVLLKDKVDWRVNMLWSEKVWFVKETVNNKYFDTEFYGWCDIGYFRNRLNDLNTIKIKNWPNPNKLESFDKNKIHYSCVNNNNNFMDYLYSIIINKNSNGVPIVDIPYNQISIAGGFFIIHKNKINWWCSTYDEKLKLYFDNRLLVKDDQIILVDCIFSDTTNFSLYKENNQNYDNWFLFQRLLL